MSASHLTVPQFKVKKEKHEKISMVTCYDSTFARILSDSPIDVLLIGDSSSMVMQGFDSTIHSTIESMEFFTASVARGANTKKFIVADMPFLTTRKSREYGVECAARLIKAGAHAVKIEGIRGNEDLVKHLTESGIPVMGHLGLTPQFINAFGGMKLQAKTTEEQDALFNDAVSFERAGAFSLVLEVVPELIASKITERLSIPTIGIGAGSGTNGQVLVLQDLLGMNPGFKPKFLRTYANLHEPIMNAMKGFHEDVVTKNFPSAGESYS